MSILAGIVRRCSSVFVNLVDIRAILNDQLDDREISFSANVVQRRLPLAAGQIGHIVPCHYLDELAFRDGKYTHSFVI
jgi:hypothetical protein